MFNRHIKRTTNVFMAASSVNLDLMSFVEIHILPRYNEMEGGGNLAFILQTMTRCVTLANAVGADVNMAYVIGAYHDLGMSGHKAIHHLTGGKIVEKDARLKRWFSMEQIKLIKEAVEDHRATLSHAPRSIYGKIIAEAVRVITPSVVFEDAMQKVLKHHEHADEDALYELFKRHLKEKYGVNGYVKLWIPKSQNADNLQQIRRVIEDETQLKQCFSSVCNKYK